MPGNSIPDWVPYIVPVPAHFHEDDDEDSSSDGSSVYTVEEMIYLEDSEDDESVVLVDLEDESDSEIEEVNNAPGQWAYPIDLTLTSDEEGSTDSEYDDDSTDDEMYYLE